MNIENREDEAVDALLGLRTAIFGEDGTTEVRRALEGARHALVTLHGLTATDGLNAYGSALRAGCDANGAWDCFREGTWKIDVAKEIALLDAILRGDESDE